MGPDYFVLLHLKEFLESNLREQCSRNMRVADVGCGEQPYRALVQELGGNYTGFDIGQNRSGTVDRLGPITDIPAEDNAFDLVLCSEVLEHTIDSARSMSELARILRPGGRVILTTPFAYPLHEEPNDYVRVTPQAVCVLAERTGLRIVKLEQTGNELEVLATVWCNLWSRLEAIQVPDARRIIAAGMRVPVNIVVAVMSRLVGQRLPRKYYLSTLCLLEKPVDYDIAVRRSNDKFYSNVPRP